MEKPLVIIICILLSLIYGVFIFLPKYRDFNVLKAQISQKQMELNQREEYLSQLDFLSKELEKHKQSLSKIELALPLEPNLPPLFVFLQKACSENGLVFKKIDRFSTNFSKKAAEIKETEIEFETSGTFPSFLNFLLTLEKSARLIEVDSVSFALPKEGDVFSFKIKIKIHSY